MQADGLPWSHRQVGLAFLSPTTTQLLRPSYPWKTPSLPQGIASSTRLDIWSSGTSIRGHTPQPATLISQQLPPGRSLPLTLGVWGVRGRVGRGAQAFRRKPQGLDRSPPAEVSSCPCRPLRSVFINSTRPQGLPELQLAVWRNISLHRVPELNLTPFQHIAHGRKVKAPFSRKQEMGTNCYKVSQGVHRLTPPPQYLSGALG